MINIIALLDEGIVLDKSLIEVIEFMTTFFQTLSVESRLIACNAIKNYTNTTLAMYVNMQGNQCVLS